MATDVSDIMTFSSEDSVKRMLVKNAVIHSHIEFQYKDGIYVTNGSDALLKKVLVERGEFEIPSFVTGVYNYDTIGYTSPFIDCISLKVTNRSQITDMDGLFAESSIEELDLSGFSAAGAASLKAFLYYCQDLHTVDLKGFTTSSKLRDVSFFFKGCSHISSLDLSTVTTEGVTDFSHMFEDCDSLSEFVSPPDSICGKAENLLPIDINNGESFDYMFSGTKSLESLSLGVCSSALTADGMFRDSGISNLDMKHLRFAGGWPFSIRDIFAGCRYLDKVNVTEPALVKEIRNRWRYNQ